MCVYLVAEKILGLDKRNEEDEVSNEKKKIMSYLGVQGLYSLEPTGVHVAMQRQLMFDVFIIDSSELPRDRDLAMTNGLELL